MGHRETLLKEDQSKILVITKECVGLRLDQFLAKNCIVKTRSQALRLIAKNHVLLNRSNPKASSRLRLGDLLEVVIPVKEETETLSPYEFPLKIPYEDEEILVVDKPAGLVVHPAPGHEEKTLINVLFHQTKLSPGSHPLRPGVVHRLDKDTSGLLVLAKSKVSQDYLMQQFKEHNVKREYWAISFRPPAPFTDTIDTWITRHPIYRKKFISLKEFKPGAKRAVTFYKLLFQHNSGLSWLKCCLKTGRTHQIRIHLSSISCPLVGDSVYAGRKWLSFITDPFLKEQIKKLNRTALHAYSLSFRHPLSGKGLVFKSYWPADLKVLLEKLNFYKK